MNAAHLQQYRARFRKVLDHIDSNLEQKLTLQRLCDVAAFSKYHFQRQFSSLFGISAYRYIHLCRLKRAAYQLAYRVETPITEIALGCGYEGPEAFSRAFRKTVGLSPSEFRKKPYWNSWHEINQPLKELRSAGMQTETRPVKIVNFEETDVAALEHRGDPNRVGHSVRRFIEWRKQNRLPPKVSATFNIVHNDPDQVAPEDYRFDICAATGRKVGDNTFGIVNKAIPGGRCAVLRHIGSDDGLGESVKYLYREWLPRSGEAPRDFPIFFQRVKFFPDVPEAEAVTDIFLPIN